MGMTGICVGPFASLKDRNEAEILFVILPAGPEGCYESSSVKGFVLALASEGEVVWKIRRNRSSASQRSDWLLFSVQKAISKAIY